MVSALGVEVCFEVVPQQLVFWLPCQKTDEWTAAISSVQPAAMTSLFSRRCARVRRWNTGGSRLRTRESYPERSHGERPKSLDAARLVLGGSRGVDASPRSARGRESLPRPHFPACSWEFSPAHRQVAPVTFVVAV